MDNIIKKDLYRYIGSNCHSILYQIRYYLFTPAFRYIFFFRKAQKKSRFHLLWVFLLKRYSVRTGIQIPYQTSIGEGLYLGHFGQIIINERVKIGYDFNIAAGALIGASQGKRKGYPTIGDNVKVGTNAVIIGNVKIGNNVLVAPGAFINFDVPNNSVVIGNPGKIISKDYDPVKPYNRNPVHNFK